jgi:hypothetical protein
MHLKPEIFDDHLDMKTGGKKTNRAGANAN